jgi:pimeloyl-ACP methyl ester carboxylesterase
MEIDLAYDDFGEGRPVVLLHGYPFNRSMWKPQVEGLGQRYRIITPDLRGLGESKVTNGPSTTPPTTPPTMDEMAQDVAALLEHLKIDSFVVGGLSMGGYVTLAFYKLFPQRIAALILADTRAGADTDEGRRNREEQALKILSEGMDSVTKDFPGKVLTAETMMSNPDLVARVRLMISTTNPRGAANALRGMAVRSDQTDLLPSITVPTLIIVGSDDQLTPPKEAEGMRADIASSRLAVIEGAAHVSNMERPTEFNNCIAEFLDSL